jgi:hypothetical protein
MIHLSEEELIAHLYGEADNTAVSGHLDGCVSCSRAYDALRADLAEMKFVDPPARDAFYGERVWASLSTLLPARRPRKRNLLGLRSLGLGNLGVGSWKGLSYAAACILLGVCTFIGGRLWERKQARRTADLHSAQRLRSVMHAPQRVVVVVLGDHLDRSERLLVELKHTDAGNAELVSPLREEARSLLADNSLCRQKALHADDAALTDALDRLDHLLRVLADQPEGLSSTTLTQLQHEIDAGDLLLDVRVLRSRLPKQETAASGQTKGGVI